MCILVSGSKVASWLLSTSILLLKIGFLILKLLKYDSFGHANALLTSGRLPGARLAPLKAHPTLAEGGEALQCAWYRYFTTKIGFLI